MPAQLKRLNEIYPADVKSTVPLGVRVNDMVYATNISAADPATGEVSGDIKEQTAKALQRMKELIERAGGKLENVARGVGYCTNAEDRTPVDEVWMEMFPDEQNKPAMKVLLAELPPGQLVRIDVLALLGATRTRFDIPNVSAHDPTIKIGNWVFSSRCHGNDQSTGQIVEGGLEAEARQTIENLTTLVKLAGGSDADIMQITTFGREPDYLPAARKAFEERFPDAQKRPRLNQVVNFVSSRMQVAMEMLAALPGGDIFQEIYLDQEHNSLPAGARIGPLVVAPMLMPVDPASQKPAGADMEEQLRSLFRNMDRILEQTECGRGDVARVTLFMRQVSDRTAMNNVYQEWYPDENTRPPHKYVPAELPEGIHVMAQIIAMPGGGVRDIEIEGIHHQDYMSLGGRCGNIVTSSRIFGTNPETGKGSQEPEEHTSFVFGNADRILKLAGGSWENIAQGTAFIGSMELKGIVEKEWKQRVSDKSDAPLHFIETSLGGQSRDGRPMAPRLEIIAVLDQ
jgi:enamine deaminase RidA (YjgF/YER057c/UK114 family)